MVKVSTISKYLQANWGRYLILVRDPKSGHVTGQTFYIDDPYWQHER